MLRGERGGHGPIGILDGWKGLATPGAPLTRALDRAAVRGIQARGGTILGSSRTNLLKRDGGLEAAESNLRALGIDALVAIGGDDTLSVAAGLAARGAAVVAIPKTMDNDVWGTEGCLGFDTAANIVTDALDRIQTTSASKRWSTFGTLPGRTSMSPRLESISSSSVSVTDMGAKAVSRSPS